METPISKETILAELAEKKAKMFSLEDDPELNDYNRMIVFVNGEKDEQGNQTIAGIKDKYPDYTDYELYHFLTDSTPAKPCSKFDFPGEDSIEQFLKGL